MRHLSALRLTQSSCEDLQPSAYPLINTVMSDRANLAKPINARHLLLRQPKTGSVASEAPENKCNNRDALHGRAPARSGVAHLKKLRTWGGFAFSLRNELCKRSWSLAMNWTDCQRYLP